MVKITKYHISEIDLNSLKRNPNYEFALLSDLYGFKINFLNEMTSYLFLTSQQSSPLSVPQPTASTPWSSLEELHAGSLYTPSLYSWNDLWPASMATEIGPMVATASRSLSSCMWGMSTYPVSVAPTFSFLKWQNPFWNDVTHDISMILAMIKRGSELTVKR